MSSPLPGRKREETTRKKSEGKKVKPGPPSFDDIKKQLDELSSKRHYLGLALQRFPGAISIRESPSGCEHSTGVGKNVLDKVRACYKRELQKELAAVETKITVIEKKFQDS